MSLKARIEHDLKAALKNKDKTLLQVLRFLKAGIKNKEIELHPKPLKEEDVIAIIQKQVKQITESIDSYKSSQGYEDQIVEEQNKAVILKKYLPELLSKEQLQDIVKKAIQDLKPKSMKDMGLVMQASITKAKGRADGKVLSQMIRDYLQRL